MARQSIDIGVQGNDGTGDSIREAFRKVNENFRDLFAYFGQGDTIRFTDLDDTPNSYAAHQIFVSNDIGSGAADSIEARSLVAGTGINIDYTTLGDVNNTLAVVLSTGAASVVTDPAPVLGGPLNANSLPIGKLPSPSSTLVNQFNAVYGPSGTTITIEDLAIPKGYADGRYPRQASKSTAVGQIRTRSEPISLSEYTKTIASWVDGNATVTGHGFTSANNGISFKYASTGTPATGLTSGATYYLRYITDDSVGLYATENDAITDTNKLVIPSSGSGTQSLVDLYLDTALTGNWLSNEALPRSSAVRRQGDIMTGSLYLSDHPGALSGAGSPNGVDDLQAATKYYVDNSSFASKIDLFVSNTGDDTQANVPTGKEGRAFAYSYATVNAACSKALQLIEASEFEPDIFRQTITYTVNNVTTNSPIGTVVYSGGSGYTGVRDTISANRAYIREEVIGYINTTYPTSNYDSEIYSEDIGKMLDAIVIDAMTVGTYQSIKIGKDYFNHDTSNLEQSYAIGATAYVKYLTNRVLQGLSPANSYQTVYTRQSVIGSVTSPMRAAVDSLFDVITDILTNGVDSASQYTFGTGVISLTVTNGGVGYVDQATPSNIELAPGKILKGKSSGATARIVSYTAGVSSDTLTSQLLTSTMFTVGEHLEFALPSNKLQIIINVESGTYYEDLPIKVPENVSIVGSDDQRTIIRPNNRSSQSTWADTYFFRDKVFDNLRVTAYTSATQATATTATPSATSGSIVVTLASATVNTSWFGSFFKATQGTSVPAEGVIDVIYMGTYSAGTTYLPGHVIEYSGTYYLVTNTTIGNTPPNSNHYIIYTGEVISASKFGVTLFNNFQSITTVISGNWFVYNTLNWGRHYLVNPAATKNVGSSYTNVGAYTNAAKLIKINKSFIQAEVIGFINTTYPVLSYDQALYSRDMGDIVDALVSDLTNGGKINVENVATRYPTYTNSVETTAAINYISTLISKILLNLDQIVSYQGTVTQVKNTALTAESGAFTVVPNLIATVVFAFDGSYNPPKNNNEIDVFLLNNASKISNVSAQLHGGFMCVLDSAGTINSNNPVISHSTSISNSTNNKKFTGGVFIDGCAGRLSGTITSTSDAGKTITVSGLTYRTPLAPTEFYSSGVRYQIASVSSWDSNTGIATLKLDPDTPWSSGNIPITIETPGDKSIIVTDCTNINDLGYGIVAHNNGVVSDTAVFSQYCYTSRFASNGGQIRSIGGYTEYGKYGLRAVGFDPTESPDQVYLNNNLVQTGKIFKYDSKSSIGVLNATVLYLKRYSNIPTNTSEFELYQDGAQKRYEVKTIETTGLYDNVYTYRLTNATQANPCVLTLLPNSTITGASTASPCVITSVAHGRIDGDFIKITAVAGMTEVNNRTYYVKYIDPNSFSLYTDSALTLPVDSSAYTVYTSGGTISTNSTLHSGDRIKVSGVVGMTQLNSNLYYAKPLTATTIALYSDSALSTTIDATGYTAYSSGGTVTDNIVYSISGATKASPCVVTLTDNHNYADGDIIVITSVVGMTQINSTFYVKSTGVTANQIQLYSDSTLVTPVDSTLYSTYTSGGSMSGGQEILKLTLSTSATNNRISTGLVAEVYDNENATISALQNFKFNDLAAVTDTRPSTALKFIDTSTLYRVISYNLSESTGATLPANYGILTSDLAFEYLTLTIKSSSVATVDPLNGAKTLGSTIGDIRIAIDSTSITDAQIAACNSNKLIFGWEGKVHKIVSYTAGSPAYITTSDVTDNNELTNTGISTAFSALVDSTIHAGLPSSSSANITVNISTCRATGHDFNKIGTGSYSTTNHPAAIYGNPIIAAVTENEIVEETTGRVFYVTTDQDGTFNVGKYFKVDQGTGTVTFSAAISLSNIDGLGFKRGVVVSEFSTDSSMTSNASDTVSTQSAVRGYIDKRLGLTHSGAATPSLSLIGPGFMALNGSLAMTGDMSLGNNKITNSGAPSSDTDLANKIYVDTQVSMLSQLSTMTDVSITAPQDGQFLVYEQGDWHNATMIGDVSAAFDSGAGKIATSIVAGSIVNNSVSASAAIAQSKLALSNATAAATTGAATKGISSFDSANFQTDGAGFVSIKNNGITLSKIATIGNGSVLGNFTGSSAVPQEVTSTTVTTKGLDSMLSGGSPNVGAVQRTGSEAFSVVGITTSGAINSLVKTDGSGVIDAQGLKINSASIIDYSSTTINFKTPGGLAIMSASGASEAATTVTLKGQFVLGPSSTLTVSSATTAGTATNANFLNTSGSYRTGATTATADTVAVRDSIGDIYAVNVRASSDMYASEFRGMATYSAFADLAEFYTSDKEYTPGTVLIFGGTAETTVTNVFGDNRLAGVVTTNPGLIMNDTLMGTRVCIALQGRVPVRVIGKIKKGEMLTTAGVPGCATKSLNPLIGTIIGKALVDKDSLGEGVIEVAIGRV